MKRTLSILLSAAMGLTILNYPGLIRSEVNAKDETTQEINKDIRESLDSSLVISRVNSDQSESQVTSLEISHDEKVQLRTNAEGNICWQIKLNDSLWASISDADSPELTVSWAMIENMLNDNNSVEIRVLVNEEEHKHYSSPLLVKLVEKADGEVNSAEAPSEDDYPDAVQDVIVDGPVIVTPEQKGSADISANQDSEESEDQNSAPSNENLNTEPEYEEDLQGYQNEPEGLSFEENSDSGVNYLKKKIYRLNEDEPSSENLSNNPEVELLPIVVYFRYTDGTDATAPYTATVAKGSDFHAAITSPTIPGYAAPEEDRVFDIDIQNIQEGFEKIVTYSPAAVNFKLNVYYQNIGDDNYTLSNEDSKPISGITKEPVSKYLDGKLPNREGFLQLPFDSEVKIAHDGSTVIEVYYDRLYYLVLFDLDGGFGTEPVYGKFGSPLIVKDPEKPGHRFDGWQDEDGNSLSPTIPAKNPTNYYAQWIKNQKSKVTVVFWGQNPDKYDSIPDSEDDSINIKGYRVTDDSYSWLADKVYEDQTVGEILGFDDLETRICSKQEHDHSDLCYKQICGKTSHVHKMTECYSLSQGRILYDTPVSKPSSAPNNPSNGYVHVVSHLFGIKSYYVYYGGSWYSYVFNGQSNKDFSITITKKCQEEEHSHTKDCNVLDCDIAEHTHTYDCHDSSKINSLLNDADSSRKWILNLNKSDRITVLPDGTTVLNVYFDRAKYKMRFQSISDDLTSIKYLTLYEKWGTNIHAPFQWVSTQYECPSWAVNKNSGEKGEITYIQVMPYSNKFYYKGKDEVGTEKTIWYTQKLGSKNPEPFDETNYEEFHSVRLKTNSSVNEQEFILIPGFERYKERPSAQVTDEFVGAKFYYLRKEFELSFGNIKSEKVSSNTHKVQFEEPLSKYGQLYSNPEPPEGLYESGSVKFAGWYKNEQCSEGQEVDLDQMTMPASNFKVYAKWIPVSRHLTFRTEKNSTDLISQFDVIHRNLISESQLSPEITTPENNGLNFVGWFYEEDGVEKAFHQSMPVTKDMDLYGKWSSKELIPFTIRYVTKDASGNSIDIADAQIVSGLHGITKTVDAKTGSDLFDKYRTGYYPNVSNHSFTFDINEKNGVFEFVYTPKEKLYYTVRYLDADTKNPVADPDENVETTDAVVTAKFKFVEGWMPDAYSKRLVVSADDTKNEIIFYYSKDENHAPVSIIHMQQNVEGDGYTSVKQDEEIYLDKAIDDLISASINSYPGFTYLRAEAYHGTGSDIIREELTASDGKVATTLTNKGLQIVLYYDRIQSSYTVNYLEAGTNSKIIPSKTVDKVRFGKHITEVPVSIPGFTIDTPSASISIKEDPSENVINFYYSEREVTINYQMVVPDGVQNNEVGSLDNESENLKTFQGVPRGSAAESKTGYKFVGWFADKECTKPLSSESKFIPEKSGKDQDGNSFPGNLEGYNPATYYAKFERNTGKLRINKTVSGTDSSEKIFFFRVSNTATNINVVVPVNAADGYVVIEDLPISNESYTVQELLDWNGFDYSAVGPVEQTVQLTEVNVSEAANVDFANKKDSKTWFTDSDSKRNTFTGGKGGA